MWTLLAVALSACAYYVSIGLGEILARGLDRADPGSAGRFPLFLAHGRARRLRRARVMPVPLLVAALAATALVFAGAVLVARFAVRRLPPWAAAFAFPAAWTSYEFFFSLVSPHGSAMSLANPRTDVLPLPQIASVTGM